MSKKLHPKMPTLPKRDLSVTSRNTMLVFLVSAAVFKEWRNNNSDKDPKHEFPGFDPEAIRARVATYKETRGLRAEEVVQHLDRLNDTFLVSRRPSFEKKGQQFHFTLTKKGEAFYDQVSTVRIQTHPVLEFLLNPASEKYWHALIVMASLARPKSDGLTDSDIASMSCLSESAAATGRRMAKKGFTALGSGGQEVTFKVALISDRTSAGTKRCLHPDYWLPEKQNLDDIVEALVASPAPSPVRVAPQVASESAPVNGTTETFHLKVDGGVLATIHAATDQKGTKLRDFIRSLLRDVAARINSREKMQAEKELALLVEQEAALAAEEEEALRTQKALSAKRAAASRRAEALRSRLKGAVI